MILQVLQHTPLWVWALFAALLALGLSQRRTRQVRPGQLLVLPLALLALGLWSMAPGFVAQPVVALLWIAALAIGIALGRRLTPPAGTAWLAQTQRLQLPGSWWPMVIIVLIFSLRYASGVGQALHPEWRADLAVQVPLALVFGTLSGLLLGRSFGLLALTRSEPTTMPPHGQSSRQSSAV